jgi:EAL and modified HD-GYP domain-containing signal transduction protein
MPSLEAHPKYVARQPILDAKQEVVGYELLFRSSLENVFDAQSLDHATSSVIADAFLLFGLDQLTGGKPAFLNFSRPFLVGDFWQLLPRERIVVEVLETIVPDDEVIAACRRLKARGYTLALDDFSWSEAYRPLVELADVIKVDFVVTRGRRRASLAQQLRRYDATLLAEKVETREDFEQGLDAGYAWFQGYFLSRPNVVTGQDLRSYKPQTLRILELVSTPLANLQDVERAVRQDVSLCYKLLRYVNSAAFARNDPVSSIQHALALVGLDEMRKWVALLTVAGMCEDKPSELIRTALLRARFCEELAAPFGLAERSTDLFLLGLFSLLGALLDRPLGDVLAELPVAEDVALALRERRGRFADVYRAALAWERGEWGALDRIMNRLPGAAGAVPDLYRRALAWLRDAEEFVG